MFCQLLRAPTLQATNVYICMPPHTLTTAAAHLPRCGLPLHMQANAGVPTQDLYCNPSGCCCQAMWSMEAPTWGCVRGRTTLAGAWSLSLAAGMCLAALPISALAGLDCVALLALRLCVADIESLSFAC